MKEPIQQSGSEVSIIIYDAPLPPRYLRFSKRFIRTLFVVTPIVLGLCFVTLFFLGLGNRLKDTPTPKMPTIVENNTSKVQTLEDEIQTLNQTIQSLQERIANIGPQGATTGANGQEEPFLMGIKKPYGMQNLITENRVSLDQFEMNQEGGKTILKFQIVAKSPENRVTGHVLVFMISENGLMAYPAEANLSIAGGMKYNMGEPFAVSRLRPTKAEFNQKVTGSVVKFVIYIFSRDGDLLLVKETESYKIGK